MAKGKSSGRVTPGTSLSLIGGLPNPTVEHLPLVDLEVTRNFREDSGEYGTPKATELMRSLSEFGQMGGHQLTVHRYTGPDGKTHLEVVCGCRRTYMARYVNAGVLPDGKGLPTGVKQRDFATMECTVYENLTPEQEDWIRADHMGSQPLSAWEKFLVAERLFAHENATYEKVASAIGMASPTMAQKYYAIANCGPATDLRQAWYDKCHDVPGALNITLPLVGKLYDAWNRDARLMSGATVQQQKRNLSGQWGPESGRLWEEIHAQLVRDRDMGKNPTGSARAKRTAETFEQAQKQYSDEPIADGFCGWAAGLDGYELSAVIGLIRTLRAENESMRQRIEDLTHENESLRSELEFYKRDQPADVVIEPHVDSISG